MKSVFALITVIMSFSIFAADSSLEKRVSFLEDIILENSTDYEIQNYWEKNLVNGVEVKLRIDYELDDKELRRQHAVAKKCIKTAVGLYGDKVEINQLSFLKASQTYGSVVEHTNNKYSKFLRLNPETTTKNCLRMFFNRYN